MNPIRMPLCKRKWRDIWPSMVTHTRNSCSAFTHPKCTHTAMNTHTHTHTPWTHTRSSGQPFMQRRPGSSCGFGVLLKGTSVVVLRVKRALYIHSPHLQFLPVRDSNSQPFDYKSDSLTIRPRLPPNYNSSNETKNTYAWVFMFYLWYKQYFFCISAYVR